VPLLATASYLAKILRLQFDRRTMWRAIRSMVPGIAIAVQGFGSGYTLFGD
jgi:hypothetical protein